MLFCIRALYFEFGLISTHAREEPSLILSPIAGLSFMLSERTSKQKVRFVFYCAVLPLIFDWY